MARRARTTPSAHKKSAAEHERFHVIDGNTLGSIAELANALDTMSDDAFYYHVGEQRNDFATWVRDVFGEQHLAAALMETTTREQALIAVLKHLLKMA